MLEFLGTILGAIIVLAIFGGLITVAVRGFLQAERSVNRSLRHERQRTMTDTASGAS